MAGGKVVPSVKKKPPHQIGMKVNEVARGAGEPFGADGSGKNKAAKALESKGIKAGKQPHVNMVVNKGNDSPIGKERPTQDGGPRAGQRSGVDSKVDSFPAAGNDWRNRKPNKHGETGSKVNAFDYYSKAR